MTTRLHGGEGPRSREVAEVEAEPVAYIVCNAIGLDTRDYSFAYVARWSNGDTDLVKSAPNGPSVARGASWSLCPNMGTRDGIRRLTRLVFGNDPS